MRALILLALTVLVAGCTLTPCDPPMKTINGECCLDSNANAICDNRENITQTECQLPYIAYVGGCCLDANGNGLCDDLETAEETATTTTETMAEATTTSSTLPANQTASSTTSTTFQRRPTTTTTTTVPDLGGGGCYDSDGENPGGPGVTAGQEAWPPHPAVVHRDSCRDNQTVEEYYCENGYVHREPILCESWQTCRDGRCCLPSGTQCRSSAECCDGECLRRLYFSMCV